MMHFTYDMLLSVTGIGILNGIFHTTEPINLLDGDDILNYHGPAQLSSTDQPLVPHSVMGYIKGDSPSDQVIINGERVLLPPFSPSASRTSTSFHSSGDLALYIPTTFVKPAFEYASVNSGGELGLDARNLFVKPTFEYRPSKTDYISSLQKSIPSFDGLMSLTGLGNMQNGKHNGTDPNDSLDVDDQDKNGDTINAKNDMECNNGDSSADQVVINGEKVLLPPFSPSDSTSSSGDLKEESSATLDRAVLIDGNYSHNIDHDLQKELQDIHSILNVDLTIEESIEEISKERNGEYEKLKLDSLNEGDNEVDVTNLDVDREDEKRQGVPGTKMQAASVSDDVEKGMQAITEALAKREEDKEERLAAETLAANALIEKEYLAAEALAWKEWEEYLAAEALAEKERLDCEALIEQERVATEALAEKEWEEHLATEALVEKERIAAEALVEKEEEEHLAAEALAAEEILAAEGLSRRKEEERLAAESLKEEKIAAETFAEKERLACEALAEEERLACETLARREEEERVAAEALAEKEYLAAEDMLRREEEERLAAEQFAIEEQERLAAEDLARMKEEESLAAEKFAIKEKERLAAEDVARMEEEDRLAAEAFAIEEERFAAEALAMEKEEDRLAAEVFAIEEERLAAADLAMEEEEERLAAEVFAIEEEMRLAADALAMEEEEERLAAETFAIEEEMRLAADALAIEEENDRLAAEESAIKEEEERLAAEVLVEEAPQEVTFANEANQEEQYLDYESNPLNEVITPEEMSNFVTPPSEFEGSPVDNMSQESQEVTIPSESENNTLDWDHDAILLYHEELQKTLTMNTDAQEEDTEHENIAPINEEQAWTEIVTTPDDVSEDDFTMAQGLAKAAFHAELQKKAAKENSANIGETKAQVESDMAMVRDYVNRKSVTTNVASAQGVSESLAASELLRKLAEKERQKKFDSIGLIDPRLKGSPLKRKVHKEEPVLEVEDISEVDDDDDAPIEEDDTKFSKDDKTEKTDETKTLQVVKKKRSTFSLAKKRSVVATAAVLVIGRRLLSLWIGFL